MNKANLKGYTGKLFFHKNVKYGNYICGMEGANFDDYYCVGECDVDVHFGDEKKKKIQAIEKSMEKEQSDSSEKLEKMKERIIELIDPLKCPF